ncbi:MAG TPA: glycosyltransferase family 4 protein [Candidatus Saccharimonadia bacterium]
MLGWELPPYNSGGLGVACYYLCQAMAERNIEIDFIVPYLENHGVDFMKVVSAMPVSSEITRRAGGIYDSRKWTEEMPIDADVMPGNLHQQRAHLTAFTKHYVTRNKVDVIHAHEWLTFEAGVAAKKLTGKPLIAHVHATEFDRSGELYGNPLVHEIEETALSVADRIIAVSQLTKDLIAKHYGIPAEKIEVIHNGLTPAQLHATGDAASYQYLRAMKHLGYKVVVNVGRLTAQKGLRYLLEAAALVVEKNPKTLFLLVGSGEIRDELITRSAELGIAENIIFTGFLRGTAWRDAFAIGDLFVMPSVSEPFGLTALESLALGTPVLLSRTCGVAEVARNTLKVNFWDTRAMADNILMVLDEPALHHELLVNGQHDIAGMAWLQAAERCAEIYETSARMRGVMV